MAKRGAMTLLLVLRASGRSWTKRRPRTLLAVGKMAVLSAKAAARRPAGMVAAEAAAAAAASLLTNPTISSLFFVCDTKGKFLAGKVLCLFL
jgi:hypothetical protein